MSFFERLLLPENLYFAWQKAKRMYRMSDGYVDQGEIAEFELNLELRLKKIKEKLDGGRYTLSALKAVPRPKKVKDGTSVNRQYYHVKIDDQVAWIAVVNALGPQLDHIMPSWSYGNRLYRPAWYEKDEHKKSVLEVGPYRHASGHLYRKFQHSWPLYRRQIAWAARAMVGRIDPEDFDKPDQLAYASAIREGLPYLDNDFWLGKPEGKTTDLYYASIDLKQFYPNISCNAVLRGLTSSGFHEDEKPKVTALLKKMLAFTVDLRNLPTSAIGITEPEFKSRKQNGIPTGLFVAGFLANAAMLGIDAMVEERVFSERKLAHFRFVDDHAIIAYTFDDLCDWIAWYEAALAKTCEGVEVNSEKYDPPALSEWMSSRSDKSIGSAELAELRQAAVNETKFNGSNPTKLLTKTLGQVSAIAATNADILDDNDLKERLKLLEWLLLADIPDRELRSDTRAAFAAGQIATLTPLLIQETDGLVEETRALNLLQDKKLDTNKVSREAIEAHKTELEVRKSRIKELQNDYDTSEKKRLRHCFGLLLQAFSEHPSKVRLFYRLIQFCRLTGHNGISDLGSWLSKARDIYDPSWADYYSGLALQVLAENLQLAFATVENRHGLRTDRLAATRFIEQVSELDFASFSIPEDRQSWFHKIGMRDFAVTALALAEVLRHSSAPSSVADKFAELSSRYVQVTFRSNSDAWRVVTGYRPGVWSHIFESHWSDGTSPSGVWRAIETCFKYVALSDRRASRRYPERLSKSGWSYFASSKSKLLESDSGWVKDIIANDKSREDLAARIPKRAFARAVRNIHSDRPGRILVREWTAFTSTKCNAFDPRSSEWTALEIVRQALTDANAKLISTKLDHIHPDNITIPENWTQPFENISWHKWRDFVGSKQSVKFLPPENWIIDYRYRSYTQKGIVESPWERHLTATGRLLLGLLHNNHDAPRLWNLRGNERVSPIPLRKIFQSLAISSPTLLLLESCLSTRSAETRTLALEPTLFGAQLGDPAKDDRFDPPIVSDLKQLLAAIENAQSILTDNQLAVSRNQPRQLIPVRIEDLALGTLRDELEGIAADAE